MNGLVGLSAMMAFAALSPAARRRHLVRMQEQQRLTDEERKIHAGIRDAPFIDAAQAKRDRKNAKRAKVHSRFVQTRLEHLQRKDEAFRATDRFLSIFEIGQLWELQHWRDVYLCPEWYELQERLENEMCEEFEKASANQ